MITNRVTFLVSKLRVNPGNNRSLCDTNMRLGTKDPHILLIEKNLKIYGFLTRPRKNVNKLAMCFVELYQKLPKSLIYYHFSPVSPVAIIRNRC